MKKTGLILLSVLTLSAVLRLWNLGAVPSGITNDESLFIYNAYSIVKTGKDTTGKFLPLAPRFDNSLSPVSFYIIAPFVGTLGLSAFSARLPYAIAGILSVFLLYKIVLLLTKKNALALACAFVLSVSPWHVHMSRIAYEQTLALFFMLLTLYSMLRYNKSNLLLLSLIPFTLSFYSYNATKIFLVVWYPATLYFLYRRDPNIRKKSVFSCILGSLFILTTFFILIKTQSINRQDIFFWSDMKEISTLVDWERRINFAPQWIQPLFNNKVSAMLRMARENYLEAFSPQFLFLYGETSGLAQIYGTSWRGMMYIIELPFFLVGLYFLFRRWKLEEKYILLCLLLSPLPAAFTVDRSYGARAIMMVPFLSTITGLGIYTAIGSLSKRKKIWFMPVMGICVSLYVYLICSYVYQYHFRYRLYGAESFFQSSKELAEYINERFSLFQQILLVDGGGFVHQYAFYTKMPPDEARQLYTMPMPKQYKHLRFIDSCIENETASSIEDLIPPGTLYIVPAKCHTTIDPTYAIRDKGEPLRVIWKIYEHPMIGN